jgi:hypothetical protein
MSDQDLGPSTLQNVLAFGGIALAVELLFYLSYSH